jgi:hypothetical protein
MPAVLRNLKLNRIDLVDDPANPQARVALKKRADASTRRHPDLPARTAGVRDHDIGAAMTKAAKTFFKRLADLFKEAEAGGLMPLTHSAEPAADGLDQLKANHAALGEAIKAYGTHELPPEHPVHALKGIHERMGKDIAAKEAAAGCAPQVTKSDEDDPEDPMNADVAKRMEAVEKTMVDLRKRAEDAEVKAKTAEERATKAEEIAKAEKDARALETEKTALRKFRHVQIDVEKDAPVFKKLRETDQASYDAVMQKLTAAEAVAKTARVLEHEIGSSLEGGPGGSAWKEIEAEAEKLVSKDTKLTKAKAIERVMETRTDLVKRYYAEDAAREPVVQ